MTSEPTTLAGDMFFDDQIYEILLRLPVISLLRFKTVSKPWLSLISNPNFIKSHAIAKRRADEALIVFFHRFMYPLNLDSYKIERSLGSYYTYLLDLPYTVVGCYNGVVCVSLADFPNHYDKPEILFWNPATKQFKLLPRNIISYYPRFFDDIDYKIRPVSTGFGFDPKTNDFKVVRVVRISNKPICAEVYSANKDVWRVLDEPNLIDVHYRFDVCADGFLCYVGSDGMMVFDLNKEVFKTGVNLPVDDGSVHITDLNDMIAVVAICKNKGLNGSSKIRLWTLDDHACLGNGEVDQAAWSQMLSIDVHMERQFVNVYFNRGDLILVSAKHNYWHVYDTDKKESRLLRINTNDHPLGNWYKTYKKIRVSVPCFYKYTESLFTIPGSSPAI